MATTDDAPGPLDDLIPADPIMAAAWLGSVHFILGQPGWMRAFRDDTGLDWSPPRSGLDAMIDRASGADLALVRAFLKWHNEAIWGEEEAGSPIDVG